MDTLNKIKGLLADHIGVESEDINNNDLLLDDLHMTPSDLADFFMSLEAQGYDITKLNMGEIQSVEDLVENLSSEAEGI